MGPSPRLRLNRLSPAAGALAAMQTVRSGERLRRAAAIHDAGKFRAI
jgi:hypothetical protein